MSDNGLRGFFGKHFGAENVLWVAGEGRESLKEVREMTEARRDVAFADRLSAICAKLEAIRATERVMAGGQGEFTEQEFAFLPELLLILRRELVDLEQSDLRDWMR